MPTPDAPHLTDDDDRSLEAIRRQLDEQYPHSKDVTVSESDAAPWPGPGGIALRVRRAATTVGATLLVVGVGGAAGLLAARLLLGDATSLPPVPEPAASPLEPAPPAPRAVVREPRAIPPRTPAGPDERVASSTAPAPRREANAAPARLEPPSVPQRRSMPARAAEPDVPAVIREPRPAPPAPAVNLQPRQTPPEPAVAPPVTAPAHVAPDPPRVADRPAQERRAPAAAPVPAAVGEPRPLLPRTEAP